MLRIMGIAFFLSVVIIVVYPAETRADSNFKNKEEVFGFLQEAFSAQIRLTEQEQSYEEVKGIIGPFFSEAYQEMFLKENLVEYDGKFVILGSDFAPYYIPFFQYNEQTHVAFYQNKIFIYEYFPGNVEGPVSYESHYEGILMEQMAGEWKISEYLHLSL